MKNCLALYKNLTYYCYKVQINANDDVVFDAWPGAIIRNNLLFAAEQIRIQKTGRSLREQIDVFPLEDDHPLYKELKDGFPKGYVLTDFSTTDTTNPYITIRKGELVSFSLLLIGYFNDYRFYFFEAIRQMCERGFGKPVTPFLLSAISETPSSPVSLSGFLQTESNGSLSGNTETPSPSISSSNVGQLETVDDQAEIKIRFLTPVMLFRMKEKKNTQLSYQDKTNRFPSLYQLVRSSFLRIQKLYALYENPSEKTNTYFDETTLESYLENATQALLKSANIQHISLQNTQKKGMKNEMPLSGYTGKQSYYGNLRRYLPLLRFSAELGVGNETVYGMGRFEIVEQRLTSRINVNLNNEVENEVKALDSFLLTNEETNDCQPKMVKLQQLIVRFKNQISQREIPLFAESINILTSDALLNEHDVSGKQYGYPLIQFKRINGKRAIICIGKGTERIVDFFPASERQMNTGMANGHIDTGLNKTPLEIEAIKAENIIIQAWENHFTYSIRKYLPLSHENHAVYQDIYEDSERYEFIEKIIRANIGIFTNSIGICLDKEIVCILTELEEKSTLKYKNQPFTSFDLKFKSNVSLPDYIGLGIGVSHGFGTVVRVRSQKNS